MELISIIIPVYNIEKYLGKCIESILDQSYENLEIILVNDGSTDESAVICDNYKAKDKRIIVFHQNNQGVSAARNVGLDNAKGKYIGFIDGDDFIDQDMFSSLVDLFINNEQCDLAVSGFYKDFTEERINSEDELCKFDKIETLKQISNPSGYRGYLWNKLFKRELIERIKLRFNRDIHVCEDTLFCHEYMKEAEYSFFLNSPKYHYITRSTSAVNTSFNSKKLTVLDAYEKIMNISYNYNDEVLNNTLKCNYVRHCQKIILKIIRSNESNKKDLKKKYKNLMKRYLFVYLQNKNIPLKYKILAIFIIIN